MPSIPLPDAKVYRGGVTARRLVEEPIKAQVSTSRPGAGVRNEFQTFLKGWRHDSRAF